MSQKDIHSDEESGPDDVETRDWSKLKQSSSKMGYKAGIIAGREASVQDAFAKAYHHTANSAFTTLAKWRGILSAVLCYFDQTGEDASANRSREKITKLIEKLMQVQQVLATPEREHLTMLSTLIGQSEEVRSSIANSSKESHHDTSTSRENKNHEKPKCDSDVSSTKDKSPSTLTGVASQPVRTGFEQEVSKKKMRLSADNSAAVHTEPDPDVPLNLVVEKKPKRNFKLDLAKPAQTDDYKILMMSYEDKTRMMEIQKECKKVVAEVGLDRISHMFDTE